MCEHGQHGLLSARPRSGRVKQLGVWGRCELPRGVTNFRPSRRLEISLSTLKERRALLTLKKKYVKVEGRKTE